MAEKALTESVDLSDSESDTATHTDDYSEMALQGIGLLLNNEWDQATQLFNKYK